MNLRWKILIGVGIFLVLMAASVMVSLHTQPAGELEAYKKILRDQGEKLDLSEVQPPPVAPEDNSVNAVRDAFRMFPSSDDNIPYAMQMVAPGRALIGWMQPEARGYDFTNSWVQFAAEVAADRPAIELLHEVLDRPRLDFQLDYKLGEKLPLTHLAPLKRSSHRLTMAAVLELHNGNPGAAATNILILLALVHKNEAEGLLISHLVRIAMTAIAVSPTWELLQATNVTEAQLAAVQNGWRQMDFLGDAEYVFGMERAWMPIEIQKSRSSHEGFMDMFGSYGYGYVPSPSGSGGWADVWEDITKGPRMAVSEGMWRSSWSYAEELRALKSSQIILETVRMMQTNRSQFYKADLDAMSSRVSSLGLTNAGSAFFNALNIPDFRGEFSGHLDVVPSRTLRIETARRVVIAAIALKRFQLKYGRWPQTLDKLMPEFISSVPIDPYDGKPLKYHPNADGTYLLYSVGEDGVDDGGDPTSTAGGSTYFYWQNPKARDWVWPQPASPAEVQYFYEQPPK